ncbi:unnamed protein product [Euphydryas editha]|uniref:Uncharacterized protein n=1 Tax=Euphydryas editha TaxID=104508 RepID=A0AAU9U4R6_EUPED|nr:unnamed protein product [Euphydryas editha]
MRLPSTTIGLVNVKESVISESYGYQSSSLSQSQRITDFLVHGAICYTIRTPFLNVVIETFYSVALAPPPAPVAPVRLQDHQDGTPSETNTGAVSQYAERPPDFGEYVDFGAHTGDNGAFGWYADYPVNNHDTSGFRK